MVGGPAFVAEEGLCAPRVDDRRVLNDIFWRLRTGALYADVRGRYGPAA
ncbi:transposase [Labrys sp. KNU-23]|nr:transposase [Labrys sp. KNU-23]